MLFDDQLAALVGESQQVRHPGRRARLRAAGRRPRRPSASRASRSTSPTATSRRARRKFIVADTPGHEQYTRNMVTGASTADAGRAPGRCAQGRADADPAPQLPRVAARDPARGARRQQDGPGRLLAGAVPARSRRATASSPRELGLDRHRLHPALGAHGDNVVAPQRAHALVRGADAARASWRASRSTSSACARWRSACRCSGSTARTRLPRLRRHDRARDDPPRATGCARCRPGARAASRASSPPTATRRGHGRASRSRSP